MEVRRSLQELRVLAAKLAERLDVSAEGLPDDSPLNEIAARHARIGGLPQGLDQRRSQAGVKAGHKLRSRRNLLFRRRRRSQYAPELTDQRTDRERL